MTRRTKNYLNCIYGLDIETSTVEIDEERACSFMYSFCISSMNINTGTYKEVKAGRSYKELDEWLFNLNDTAISLGVDFIIYIHNFSYEASFFLNNLQFFREYEGYSRYLFMKANKPLFIKIDHIEFRCSYLLLSKSIKALGKSLNLPKLDYNYKELRTPIYPKRLPSKDLEYNYRDVEIMLKSIYRLYRLNKWMQSANDLPYTKTGVMRFNCEHNPAVNEKYTYINKYGEEKKTTNARMNKWLCQLEKAKTKEQLEFWEILFQGGLVTSNAKYIGDIIYNIASFDFSSDYPFQMLVRFFPSDFEVYIGNCKRKMLELMQGVNATWYIHRQPMKKMFNAKIIISNVRAKYDFHPVGTSKITELEEKLYNGRNCIIINGKIVDIKPRIEMTITCIDMITLALFYDFTLVDVTYLEIAKRYKRSNQFKLKSVEYNGKIKADLKPLVKLIEDSNKYKQYTEEELPDSDFRELINLEKDYFSQLSVAEQLYLASKSDLNAQYGDNAQHLIHKLIKYNVDSREWESDFETFDDYIDAQSKTSYIYGLYVPQYARASILYIAYQFVTNGLPVYYTDTDSIKTDNTALAFKLVDEYNKINYKILGEYQYLGFGQLENEYVADAFVSLGTKSYLRLLTNKEGKQIVKATISGLPNATKLFNELFEYYDSNFTELVENCYHYGTVFDKSITNKLSSIYKYETFDLHIGEYKERVVSGVVLKETEVTMRDFTQKTWAVYARLICSIYKKDYQQFTRSVRILRNEKGEIEIE